MYILCATSPVLPRLELFPGWPEFRTGWLESLPSWLEFPSGRLES